MYSIGDSVVYPLHGAGIIEAIEEREVSGLMHKYYAMRIPLGDMKVLIPVDGAEKIGVRDVICPEVADRVMLEFRSAQIDTNLNWNKRYRENMVKIKSGDIFQVAAVVKSLMMRDKTKGLSTGERKMLANAKQILISEIVMSKNVDYVSVEKELKEIIDEEIELKSTAE